MVQLRRNTNVLYLLILALTPACNLLLGNEDGALEEGDAGPTEDLDARANEADTSEPIGPDGSMIHPDGPAIGADVTGLPPDAAAGDSPGNDGHSPSDGSRFDADGASSTCDAGVSICAEGQVASEMQACGPCGRGVQTHTRVCAPGGCGWGPWSGWSTCTVLAADCTPGQIGSEAQPCGACNTGTQTRTRACTTSCTWGAWSVFGTCGSETAECLPDHWRCCGPGMWEWCYFNTCKWTGGCAPCNGSCSC